MRISDFVIVYLSFNKSNSLELLASQTAGGLETTQNPKSAFRNPKSLQIRHFLPQRSAL